MRKVNLQVIRPWIAKKVVELVGFEDEVVVEYAMGLLEDKQQPVRPVFTHYASWNNSGPADSRSEENADKSNRVSNKLHAVIYVRSLVFVVGSAGLARGSATDFH